MVAIIALLYKIIPQGYILFACLDLAFLRPGIEAGKFSGACYQKGYLFRTDCSS